MPSKHNVVIDESSIDPELKVAMSKANKFSIIGSDASDVETANYLEQNAGWEVVLEETAKAATLSQTRKFVETLCKRKDRPDLVLSTSSNDQSDAGAGTVIKGLVTGRIDVNATTVQNVTRCRDKWQSRFTVRWEMSQGEFNADKVKMSHILAQEYAKALMRLAGKLPPVAPSVK